MTEETLGTHSLFVHFKLMPICSNKKLLDLESKKIIELRKRYSDISKEMKQTDKHHREYWVLYYKLLPIKSVAKEMGVLLDV